MSQHWTIGSGGMVCGSCAVHSEKALQKLPGVSSTSLILGRPPGSAQQLGLDDHAKKQLQHHASYHQMTRLLTVG
jgi:hypothetical protein